MVAVNFYFQVHQPFRIRKDFSFFSIGSFERYEDDLVNHDILRKVAEKCYLPCNQKILELIQRYQGKFKVAYSISGTALDQFELYGQDVLDSFRKLAETGCVEFIAETYYHSLCFLFSPAEFKKQVLLHKKKIKELFGYDTKTFRNTELIYNNDLAQMVESMGFKAILAEGADRILTWRKPNFVYSPKSCEKLKLLVKNYRLSDDIAFRFSNKDWSEWPLTADKFACWVHQVAGCGDVVNLFMDYETFGEHQWESTGIFNFLDALPEAVFRHPDFEFLTPKEVIKKFETQGELDMPEFVSWADLERDTSAWLGNHLQDSAIDQCYEMEKLILSCKDEGLLHAWRKLQTSDHFYYMCVKWFQDGDVHKYFSPYDSPYEAFILYENALSHLELTARRHLEKQKAKKRRLARSGASSYLPAAAISAKSL